MRGRSIDVGVNYRAVGQNQVVLRHLINHFPMKTSEWLSTYVPILGCSEPLCTGFIDTTGKDEARDNRQNPFLRSFHNVVTE